MSIEGAEDSHPRELVKHVVYVGQWKHIVVCEGIKATTVNAEPQRVVFYLTNTTGLAHGLSDSCTMHSFSII